MPKVLVHPLPPSSRCAASTNGTNAAWSRAASHHLLGHQSGCSAAMRSQSGMGWRVSPNQCNSTSGRGAAAAGATDWVAEGRNKRRRWVSRSGPSRAEECGRRGGDSGLPARADAGAGQADREDLRAELGGRAGPRAAIRPARDAVRPDRNAFRSTCAAPRPGRKPFRFRYGRNRSLLRPADAPATRRVSNARRFLPAAHQHGSAPAPGGWRASRGGLRSARKASLKKARFVSDEAFRPERGPSRLALRPERVARELASARRCSILGRRRDFSAGRRSGCACVQARTACARHRGARALPSRRVLASVWTRQGDGGALASATTRGRRNSPVPAGQAAHGRPCVAQRNARAPAATGGRRAPLHLRNRRDLSEDVSFATQEPRSP